MTSPVIAPENWRSDLLALILRASVVLGGVVYLPSLYMALASNLLGVAIVDTIAVAAIIGLSVRPQLAYTVRAAVFCAICYLLGIFLLVSVGAVAQIYLFAFSLLTTLLLGLRAGLGTVLVNAVTLLVVGYLGYTALEFRVSPWAGTYAGWVVITLNFVLVNVLLALAVGAVVHALESALQHALATRASLDRERAVLRTLIDALPDVVFTKDTQGRYVISNPATVALVGLADEADLAGKTVFDLHPHEIAAPFHADDLQVLGGQPVLNREEANVDAQGIPRWFLTIKVPLRDAAGTVIGLVGISRDITTRRQADEALRESEERFRTFMDNSPAASFIKDASGRFLYANAAWRRQFDPEPTEWVGKTDHDFWPAATAELFQASDRECLTRQSVLEAEETAFDPVRREERTWLVLKFPLPRGGQRVGGMAWDVTARKQAESALHRSQDQLRHSAKMEVVGQLAGGIAHDFNNLLTVILGYCEVLIVKGIVTGPDLAMLHEIRKSGERAASLTGQLLAFSRKQMLAPRILNLNEVVVGVERLLRRLIGENLDLACALATDLWPVKVDSGQLEQVIINLAVNARDAMPEGGRITIETSNVEWDLEYCRRHPDRKPGRYVRIAVSDTGCGMTPEVRERVFEPFFTTKEQGKGTGLGLAVVHGIVQQSGGFIDVYSEVNVGTVFKVHLPVLQEAAGHAQSEPGRPALRGVETILLVEDEGAVRRLAQQILESQGYTVLAAADGSAALALADAYAGTIHLVVSDVVMPGLSGRQLVQQLLARRPEVKVLFISGYTDDAIVRHGIIEGGYRFLQKPFAPLTLSRKVRDTLDGTSNSTAG